MINWVPGREWHGPGLRGLKVAIMPKPFLDENFLLRNATAIRLYHTYAKDLPIIDYHCHIQPEEILANKQFSNLTQIWLDADHYKWRAMRSCGVEEKYITGTASDYAKFLALAKVMPQLIGNPLYHWTHLELRRYFGINQILNLENAQQIWHEANSQLTSGSLNVNAIIAKSKVEVICTTDDPLDDLSIHQRLKTTPRLGLVLPSFRPDRALAINNHNYLAWLAKLRQLTRNRVSNYAEFKQALVHRIEFFNSVGCKLSDHGLNYVPFAITNEDEVSRIFAQVLKGYALDREAETKFRSHTLIFLGNQYAKYGWVMQYHMNVTRNNNSLMFQQLGADSGFDAINDMQLAEALPRLLDAINDTGLPKTILYSLNPHDNYVLASIMGAFQSSEVPGKLQLGSGWWFNDQQDGIEAQLRALANLGALGTFIGMLTDSRSFLSYTRHEYFRRILCNLIGSWVEDGEYPNHEPSLSHLIQNICYYNARNYFNFF